MYKNVATKIQFYAFDSTTSQPKVGDAANITAYVSIDGGAVTVLADTSASELSSTNAKGSYQFDVAQAETNGDRLLFTAKSTTGNVVLYPVAIETLPTHMAIAGGAAGGPVIAGSNAGAITFAGGMTISQSVANTPALVITGNGSGNGATISGGTGSGAHGLSLIAQSTGGNALKLASTSGDGMAVVVSASGHALNLTAAGTTKHGILATGGATSSHGISAAGGGTGVGFLATGGATGHALSLVGGGTSGNGLNVTTTLGHGINLAPSGANKHGLLSTGGSSGVCDGANFAAGTGGVGLRSASTLVTGTSSANALVITNTFDIGGNFAVAGAMAVGTNFDISGRLQIADGLILLAPATVNRAAITATGNGSGAAISLTSGASGKGIEVASNDHALELISAAGNGILASGAAGYGIGVIGPTLFSGSLEIANGFLVDTVQVGNTIEFLGSFNMQDVLVQAGLQLSGLAVTPGGVAVTGNITATNASNDIRLGATERVNIATAVWNLLTTAITVAGSIGKVLMQAITGTGGTANFTITVTDGTNPVQNVAFSLYSGVTLISRGTTDVLGNFSGSGPLGTFSVALVKTNYAFAGTTRTITGNGTGTLNTALVMTPLVLPTPPVNPSLCTLFGYLVDSMGQPLAGATLVATPVPKDVVTRPVVTDGGSIFSFTPVEGISTGIGYVELLLVRTDVLSHPVTYTLSSSNGQIARTGVKLVASTKNLNSL